MYERVFDISKMIAKIDINILRYRTSLIFFEQVIFIWTKIIATGQN